MADKIVPAIKILIADVPSSLLRSKHEVNAGTYFVSSLDKAKQLLSNESFDVVFCSWHFDGCRMLELLNTLRQIKNNKMSVICFRDTPTDLTAAMELAIARTAQLMGADCYISPAAFGSASDVVNTIGHYLAESAPAESEQQQSH